MIDCSKNNDKKIVQKVSSGDVDAFYCIAERYSEKLLKYILRITNIELEDAENLLQEVFLKVFRNINEYDDNLSFSSWIYRIAHNISIDYYRKNKNKHTVSLETEDKDYMNLIDLLDSGEDIEKEYKKKELIHQMAKILDGLDVRYKQVLVLKFLEEKSYDEISDILKIPTGTVATMINRGKKQFRILSKEYNLDSYV